MVRIAKDGKRTMRSLGISVNPQHWDFDKNQPKSNCPNRNQIKQIILRTEMEYQSKVLDKEIKNEEFTTLSLIDGQKEEIKAKAADYLDIVRSFSELLREENDALEKFETDKVAALYEQKVKLVTAYRSFVAFFIKNQEGLKLLDQEDKLTLREEALKLDELQHENSKLLQTRMKVSQTIMDSIVNLAKNRTKAYSTSYGSQGKYSPLDNSKNAIAINRTL